MHNNQITCDPARIEQFLAQQMSEEEQAAFELHLDDCHDCRRRLEAAAARDDVWSGVRDWLPGEQPPPARPCEGDSTLDAERDRDATFSQATVLNLLAPSDDERMLGRLGAYEVVGVVGSGGMGVVLKAFDAALNRYVAIKLLAPHLGSSGAARKRFSREAQAAAAVVHDNVIEIYGVADAQGLPYLVTPYVRGPSLQRRLDDEGPLALAEILRIGVQAAGGLAAAHAQGLVHRDVKPANILLADGVERVKLTDFGLARAADDASLTKTGIIAGTPQYMSPEQARGESLDQRSDLFSLGSVLYAMCTGRAPFRAETSYGVLRRITDEEPRPIREINPEIPEWHCRIVARLMAKRPEDRFESAREVTELLEECLAHVQQPTVVPLPPSARPPAPPADKPQRRRPLYKLLVGAAFALALVFAGILIVLELNKGTLTIESDADNVPVRITQGDKVVEKLTVTSSGASVRIAAGRYTVEIDGESDGIVIKNGTVELHRDEKRLVRIVASPRAIASRAPAATSQIKFSAPAGMRVACATADARGADAKGETIVCPGRLDLARGKTHELHLTQILNHPALQLDATLEVREATAKSQAYLAHNAIQIALTDDDFDQIEASHFVTKVVFVPKPEFTETAVAGVETNVSTRVDPGIDPVAEASRRGTIVAILRCGNRTTQAASKENGTAGPRRRRSDEPDESRSRQGVEVESIQPAKALVGNSPVGGLIESTGPRRIRRIPSGVAVKMIAWSADGMHIAVANGNPTLILMADGTSRLKGDWKPSVDVLDAAKAKATVSLKLASDEENAVIAATPRVSHIEVTALAFSPDAKLLAVGTSIGQMKLLDARTGELVRSLDDKQARLADKETPESWKPLTRALGSVASLAFSPDGRLLAVCGSSFGDFSDVFDGVERLGERGTGPGRLKVWEVKTGKLKHDLTGHSHVNEVAFSPDGKVLASAGSWMGDREHGTGAILWDSKTGRKTRVFSIEANGGTHAIAFSPDGKLLAIGSRVFDKDNDTSATAVGLWHTASGIMEWKRSVPGWARPKSFSPDGMSVAVLCGGQSIRFLDAKSGAAQLEIQPAGVEQGERWSDFAMPPRSRALLVGGVDDGRQGFIELWNLGDHAAASDAAPAKADQGEKKPQAKTDNESSPQP